MDAKIIRIDDGYWLYQASKVRFDREWEQGKEADKKREIKKHNEQILDELRREGIIKIGRGKR